MYKFETVHQLLDKINEEKTNGKNQITVEFANPIHAYVVAATLDKENHGFTFNGGSEIGTLIINF